MVLAFFRASSEHAYVVLRRYEMDREHEQLSLLEDGLREQPNEEMLELEREAEVASRELLKGL